MHLSRIIMKYPICLEEEEGERSSTLSLDFLAIGPLVFVGARGKVCPLDEGFA